MTFAATKKIMELLPLLILKNLRNFIAWGPSWQQAKGGGDAKGSLKSHAFYSVPTWFRNPSKTRANSVTCDFAAA